MRINRSLTKIFPDSTDYHIKQEDEVLIWREQGHSRKQAEFMGPFKVV